MARNRTQGLAEEIGKKSAFLCAEQEVYLNLVRTAEKLSSDFAKLFKTHGLSDSQYNALRILRGEDKPMQVYQVAERMVTPHPDIPRLIDRLEAAGFVRREKCAEDRRVVWVTLTPRGAAVLKKLDRPVVELHQSQLGHLGRRDLASLNQLLSQARSRS